MNRLIFVAILISSLLTGCGNETLMDLVNHNKHEALINEFMIRGNWNEPNPKDFMLRVNREDDGIMFHQYFIVHLIGREEKFPKDMYIVEMDRYGLCSN